MSTPLHDPGAEKTILGGVIMWPAKLSDVATLEPADFYDPRHTAIWCAIRELDKDQAPIDVITVYDMMGKAGTADNLRSVGGRDYLTQLTAEVITLENHAFHVQRLKALARRRLWLSYARRIAVEAADEGIDTGEFLDQAERGALQLTARPESTGGPRMMPVILKEVMREIEERSENRAEGGVTGIATKLTKFDRMTLGLQPGDLNLIAARPSMGKTALALNAIAEAIKVEEPSLLFSLEMRDRAQIERMLARESEVSASTIRSGRLDREEWVALSGASSRLSVRPLQVDDRGSIDITEIRSTARAWRTRWAKKHEGKIGIIVVDYLQLVSGPSTSGRNDGNREREVAQISRGLKLMARELGCAVVALSQLNRSLESRADKRPMMSDLRESGALEQDADLIAFLYREVVYDKNTDDKESAELIIGKQRNGPTGTVELRWDGKRQRFYDPPDDDAAPATPRGRRAPEQHPFAPGGYYDREGDE